MAYKKLRADQGRPIIATQIPLARRFCELDLLAMDWFSALTSDPSNSKALEQYISVTRAQALLAAQLGESVATMSRLKTAADLNGAGLAAQLARHRLAAHDDDKDDE